MSTIGLNDRRIQYNTSGGEASFAYDFQIDDADHVDVYRDGTLLTRGTDYSVTGVGSASGGTIVPDASLTIASGETWTIEGDTPEDRSNDYSGFARVKPSTIDADLDRMIFMLQQVRRDADRSPRIGVDDNTTAADLRIPGSTARAGKTLGFDDAGKLAVIDSFTSGASTPGDLDDTVVDEDFLRWSSAQGEFQRYRAFPQTLSELQGLTFDDYKDGDVVFMRSRTSDGDGAWGPFYKSSADHSSATGDSAVPNDEVNTGEGDGGIYVAPDSDKTGSSGAWVRQYAGHASFLWYGVKFDGSTDNTAAIQAAVDAGHDRVFAPSNQGGEALTGAITISSPIEIEVQEGTTIKLADNTDDHLFQASGVSQIDFLGHGTLDGNRANQSGDYSVIRVQRGSGHRFQDLEVKEGAYGIFCIGASDVKVHNVEAHDGKFYGVSAQAEDATGFEDISDITITGCHSYNWKDGTSESATREGQGIFVAGLKGNNSDGNVHWVDNVQVSGNNCHDNGRHGISLTSIQRFRVFGNECEGNDLNTSFGAGILASVACRKGSIVNNECHNNYHAGILIDVTPENSDANTEYGRIRIVGNGAFGNTVSGIKNNNSPRLTIHGNHVQGGSWGVFSNLYGQHSKISENVIEDCTVNGIRLPPSSAPTSGRQQDIEVTLNKIENCGTDGGGTSAGIYAINVDDVYIAGNRFDNCGKDLDIDSSCTNIQLSKNTFTSDITIDDGASIAYWDGYRRDQWGTFNSPEFDSDGSSFFDLNAGFELNHFGMSWIPVISGAAVTGDATKAIEDGGYEGQIIRIFALTQNGITIPEGANTSNIGGTDKTLANRGDFIEYQWINGGNSGWVQTQAIENTAY